MEETKFCPICGKEVDPNAKFCPYCGANLTGNLNSNSSFANTGATPSYSPFYSPNASNQMNGDSMNSNSGEASDKGMASMICGILGLLPGFGIILCIVALVLGAPYRNNDTKAKAGFVMGIIGIVAFAIELVVIIIVAVTGAINIINNGGQISASDFLSGYVK
mgnify:CR=1 FL=1